MLKAFKISMREGLNLRPIRYCRDSSTPEIWEPLFWEYAIQDNKEGSRNKNSMPIGFKMLITYSELIKKTQKFTKPLNSSPRLAPLTTEKTK